MRFCFETKTFIEKNQRKNELAVVGSDFELTWQEFDKRVSAVSSLLQENQIDNGQNPVILYGHKSANMLVAIYAFLSLEIAYIPIDQIYPKERIEKVKDIANVSWIINTTDTELNFDKTGEILLTNGEQKVQQSRIKPIIEKTTNPDPIVYLIFTSGSTGEPKGVQITTEAVQSYVRWISADFGFYETDVFINTAVFSFDLSVFEIMTFAAIGGTILLNDNQTTSNPETLIKRVEKYNGNVWVSTPSFALLYTRMETDSIMSSIHTFLFCGEVLPNRLASSLLHNFSKARVLNTYGPTEATVATTLVEITKEIIEKHNPLPVGKSKRESVIIIENDEIIIKGPNVSIGYLNRPDLNAEKFITIEGQRAFKTGDEAI